MASPHNLTPQKPSPSSSATNATSSDLLSDMPIPTSPGYEFSDDDDSQREIENDPEGSDVPMMDEEDHRQCQWIRQESDDEEMGDEDDDEDMGEDMDEDMEDAEIYGTDADTTTTTSKEDPFDEAHYHDHEFLGNPVPYIIHPLNTTFRTFFHTTLAPRVRAWVLSLPDPADMENYNNELLVQVPGAWNEVRESFGGVRDWVSGLPNDFDWGGQE